MRANLDEILERRTAAILRVVREFREQEHRDEQRAKRERKRRRQRAGCRK